MVSIYGTRSFGLVYFYDACLPVSTPKISDKKSDYFSTYLWYFQCIEGILIEWEDGFKSSSVSPSRWVLWVLLTHLSFNWTLFKFIRARWNFQKFSKFFKNSKLPKMTGHFGSFSQMFYRPNYVQIWGASAGVHGHHHRRGRSAADRRVRVTLIETTCIQ